MFLKLYRTMMAQRVGDRDDPGWSIKTISFTIPANPISDRVQLVIEVYESDTPGRFQ